jgi:pimeloyl-ACP methyl ester carboxylesterase
MISFLEYHDVELRYQDTGKGDVIVLLHGYLESIEIWEGFLDELSEHYRVIAVDLPGHGESGCISRVNTMTVMADAVKYVLDYLNIRRAVITGHSMGGYAALAFTERYPKITMGLILFHSHALPDSEEKKANRDREIELVKNGKKLQIVNTNIPRAFADDNLEKFAEKIRYAKEIAASTSDQGIICALEGIKIRPDRRHVLTGSAVPVMIIAGRKDNYIPIEVAEAHFNLVPQTDILVLENSGHMGFIEEKERSLEGILEFLKKIY